MRFMRNTCSIEKVSKMIQIRDVSDTLHRQLRIRAAEAGLSLTAYLREELEALVKRRTVDDVLREWQDVRADLSPEQVVEAVQSDRQ